MDAKTILLAMNERLGRVLRDAVDGLDEQQLAFRAPAVDERTIAEVATHAYTSLLGFTHGAAGLGWPGDAPAPATPLALDAKLIELRDRVAAMIASLPDEALAKHITLPWGQQIV